MTGIRIHQCPQCELRFTSSSELEHHLADDHRPRANANNPPTAPQEPAESAPGPQSKEPEPAAEPTRTAAANRARLPWHVVLGAALVAVLVVLIVVGYAVAAWVVGAMLVALTVFLSWRRRTNARTALRR